MSEILHILSFKLLSSAKLTTELRIDNIVKNLASIIVFGGFAIGAFYFTQTSTAYLLDNTRIGLFLFHRFLSMLLFVFFLSINVGNIIVAYATFYRSEETMYLLTKPVSHVNLFIIKFLDIFFYSSTVLMLMAIAVLVGYGSYFNMSLLFYIQAIVLMFIPYMLISGCIAVMILLLVMRYAIKIGPTKLIVGLAIGYLGSLIIYFRLTNPVKLVSSVNQYYPNINEYFGFLDPYFAKFLPNHWIAESLYWTAKGDPSRAILYTGLLLIATVVVFVAMAFLAKKIFYSSWLSSLDLRSNTESRRSLLSIFSLTKASKIEQQTSVLVRKELWQFLREPSQWIHLGIISVLIGTFVISIYRFDLNVSQPFYLAVSYLVILLFSAFLIASIALRFVYPMTSIEGPSFWKVRSAPISVDKIFWIKFLVAILPIVIVSEILVIFSHHPLHNFPILKTVAIVLMMGVSFALVSLNLGSGTFFGNFKEKNPIRIASSQGATLTFLISIIYLIFLVSIIFFPLYSYFGFIIDKTSFNPDSLFYAVVVFFAVSIVMGFSALWIGRYALKRDF